jgi:hypothetical protein
MKNLLLNAVEELVVKANNEINAVRKDVNVLPNLGDKVNRVYESHDYIVNLVDKMNVLRDKLAVEFPEEQDAIKDIDKAVRIILIQIEDVLNVAYNVGNVMIDDLYNNYEDYDFFEDAE